MKEAFHLLNKSIIRVETPDIDFEEGEEELVNGKGVHVWGWGVEDEGGKDGWRIGGLRGNYYYRASANSYNAVDCISCCCAGDAEPMENGLNGEGEENGGKEEQPDKLVVQRNQPRRFESRMRSTGPLLTC